MQMTILAGIIRIARMTQQAYECAGNLKTCAARFRTIFVGAWNATCENCVQYALLPAVRAVGAGRCLPCAQKALPRHSLN